MPTIDKPKMTDVLSSNVSAVGHHAERNELHVAFKGGGHYVYHDAGPHHFNAILADKSPGTYIARHVKGKFKHTKAD